MDRGMAGGRQAYRGGGGVIGGDLAPPPQSKDRCLPSLKESLGLPKQLWQALMLAK